MTKIDKIMRQIWTVPLVSLYPPICGICGKITTKSICPKCNLELKKQAEINILQKEEIEGNLEKTYFDELIYIFKYEGQIRKLILDYKFNEKSYMYKTFVNFLLKNKKIFENIKKYDKIIPVPISKKRYKERGYNQSLLIAKEIANIVSSKETEEVERTEKTKNIKAEQINLELVNNCLIKTKNIIEQSKLNKEERQKNIQGAYIIQNKSTIANKKILLVDDIYTTGNTVNECSKILQQAKTKKIGILVLAKD